MCHVFHWLANKKRVIAPILKLTYDQKSEIFFGLMCDFYILEKHAHHAQEPLFKYLIWRYILYELSQ